MDSKRRKFLKMAGLTAIAGMGAPAAVNMLLKGEVQASTAMHAEPHGSLEKETKLGKRLGMIVDVKKFGQYPELADKCVTACHSVHNVPDFGNPKDEIKWIWKEEYEHTFPEHSHYKRNTALHELPVMTLCNHCDDPPCVRACPTQATFKSLDNGIVMMDFHRCIGCRFCMAGCPYGSRSFNWGDPRRYLKEPTNMEFPTRSKGVVEKCNFCEERLAKGKEPACVAVSNGGLVFGDLANANSEVRKLLKENYAIRRKPGLGTSPNLFYLV